MWSVDLCCSNPHDFSHFIYEYINQPIKLTEPVKFYTKLGSPGACAGFFPWGGGLHPRLWQPIGPMLWITLYSLRVVNYCKPLWLYMFIVRINTINIYRLMIGRVWKPKTAGEQEGERVRLDSSTPPPRIRACTGCSHNVDLYCSDRGITTVV